MVSHPAGPDNGPSLPTALVIAVDTEFCQAHTLTVQAAVRIDADTLTVQVYRTPAVPDLPAGFDLGTYLPLSMDRYGRYCQRILHRPVKLLDPALSPLRMALDLLDLSGVTIVSRPQGKMQIDLLGLKDCPWQVPVPPNVLPRTRSPGWNIPALNITLVTHFWRADFLRVHGRAFLEGLQNPHWADRNQLVIRSRKLIEFVEHGPWRKLTAPVLEYAQTGAGFFEVRVDRRDTTLPFGKGSLDEHSKTFLGLSKSDAISAEEKEDMLNTTAQGEMIFYGKGELDTRGVCFARPSP